MSEKKRVTMHNGRAGKSGIFTAKHNDRNFDTSTAEHIKTDQVKKNWTWHRYQKTDAAMTFDQAEKRFYEERFGKSLELQNERHRQSRHLERVKTIDEYRTSKQTCPEETILQVGKLGDTISPQLLHKIALEQINWEIKTFPNVKVLDAAIHVDEDGAPHMHKRQVWIANGKDGLTVSQNKALKEMGIERPDTSKKENRWNNAKMTYTERCRDHFQELCRKHGLDIEVEPKDASESGLSLLEYQRRQEQAKLDDMKDAEKEITAKINVAMQNLKAEQEKADTMQSDALEKDKKATAKMKRADKYYEQKKTEADTYKATMIAEGKEELKAFLEASAKEQTDELNERERKLDAREKELDARETSFTNRQQRLTEELKGTALLIGSMTVEQLEKTREKMKEVEKTDDLTEDLIEGVKALRVSDESRQL